MGSVSCDDTSDSNPTCSEHGSQSTSDVVTGSIEYYNLVAHRYEDPPSEAIRAIWMEDLITHHKAWIGLDQMGLHGNGIKVFDYCAGTGLFSRALGPHASKILGMDSSENMVIEYNKNAEDTQEAHPECEMRAVVGDLVDGKVPVAEIPDDFLPFDLLAMCFAVDFFAPALASDDDVPGLIRALASLISRIKHYGTVLILDIEKDYTEIRSSEEDEDEEYETKANRNRNGKKIVGYGSVEVRTALETLGMEEIAVIGDLWFIDPADEGQIYFLLRAKKGDGFPSDWEDAVDRLTEVD